MRSLRRPSIKKLSLRRRWMGITSMMRMASKRLERMILKLVRIFQRIRRRILRRKASKFKRVILMLLMEWHKIHSPPMLSSCQTFPPGGPRRASRGLTALPPTRKGWLLLRRCRTSYLPQQKYAPTFFSAHFHRRTLSR